MQEISGEKGRREEELKTRDTRNVNIPTMRRNPVRMQASTKYNSKPMTMHTSG
jgi:hypothetical protein